MSELQAYLDTSPPIREAVVGYLVKDNEVLLGQRTRVSDNLGHLIVAGIGGGIEADESPEVALIREMLEEIKTRITKYKKVGHVVNLSPHHPSWNLSIGIYLVTGFEGEPKKTEDIDPRWYLKDALPIDEMWTDNRITVPLVVSGKRIAGRFLYAEDGQIIEHELRELAPHENIPDGPF